MLNQFELNLPFQTQLWLLNFNVVVFAPAVGFLSSLDAKTGHTWNAIERIENPISPQDHVQLYE